MKDSEKSKKKEASTPPSEDEKKKPAKADVSEQAPEVSKKEPQFEPAPLVEKKDSVSPAKKEPEPVSDDEDVALAEDEELVVENDGDFFWLLQKAIWTLVKILFIFGIIVLIIWIIWGENENDPLPQDPDVIDSPVSPETNPPQTTPNQKQPPSSNTTKTQTSSESNEKENVDQNTDSTTQSLPLSQPTLLRDDVGTYLDWARRTKHFFETEMDTELWGSNEDVRNKRMNQFLSTIRNLVTESVQLRRQLALKINAYYDGVEQTNKMIAYHTARLNEALQLVRPSEVETHLYQKIALQQQREQYQVLFDTNRYVLQVMEIYDRSIRDVYDKARINRDAIVKNVRVVQFQNDPFRRVLTPAEWQGR